MSKRILAFLTLLEIMHMCAMDTQLNGECQNANGSHNILNLSVDRKLNHSDGQWMTTFTARRVDSGNSTVALKLEATHSTVQCHGKRMTHVEIVVKDVQANHSTTGSVRKNDLHFHHRHARNAVIFNGGMSVQRINLEDLANCTVFTNRPLKVNEMFEVRVDKRITDKGYCQGIGVMVHSPDEVKLLEAMHFSEGSWMYHNSQIYGGGNVVVPSYGANSCNLQVGDTVGVMRRDNGSLHFFVKGVDQGPAINNAPSVLHGVYEPRGSVVIGTIVV